jgi:hypothetical protein
MPIDIRPLIGLLAAGTAVTIFLMSYVGVYLVGRANGRRQAERLEERPRVADPLAHERLDGVEARLEAMAGSVKRLADAQRVWVNYQDRAAARKLGPSQTPS